MNCPSYLRMLVLGLALAFIGEMAWAGDKGKADKDKPEPEKPPALKVKSDGDDTPPPELTPEERKAAAEAVRKNDKVGARVKGDKVYLTAVELLRERDKPGRRALVSHYRYDGDVTIKAIVDLDKGEVVEVEEVPHLPTPLSPEEFEHAKQLALADPNVKKLLAPHGDKVVIELLVSRTTQKDDPAFGHRVVHLLFRVGRGYLGTRVVVDLTTERVTSETPAAKKKDHDE